MVQTPPFGQLAPAVFSFLVAAIKGGREVWNVVESLTTCVCRLQQVLGGMRDALAHAGFSFHVSRRPSGPGLRVNMRHDLDFALIVYLLTEACGVAPTGKGCGQKVADTGDSYYIIRYHREQDCGQGLSSQCFQSAQKSNKGWSSMGNRKRGPFSELLQVRRHRIVLVSLARLALPP